MKNLQLSAAMQRVAGLFALCLGLSLAGCSSSPSGPSKTDVLKGVAQEVAAQEGDWKGDYTKAKDLYVKKFGPYTRLQKCVKTGVETWSCNFYFLNTSGQPASDESIKLRHVGSKWNYVPGSFHTYNSVVSR